MREVSIKSLYRGLSREVLELPFAITRSGRVIGYVVESLDQKPEKAQSLDQEPKKGLDQPQKGLDLESKTDKGLDRSFFRPFSKAVQVGKVK